MAAHRFMWTVLTLTVDILISLVVAHVSLNFFGQTQNMIATMSPLEFHRWKSPWQTGFALAGLMRGLVRLAVSTYGSRQVMPYIPWGLDPVHLPQSRSEGLIMCCLLFRLLYILDFLSLDWWWSMLWYLSSLWYPGVSRQLLGEPSAMKPLSPPLSPPPRDYWGGISSRSTSPFHSPRIADQRPLSTSHCPGGGSTSRTSSSCSSQQGQSFPEEESTGSSDTPLQVVCDDTLPEDSPQGLEPENNEGNQSPQSPGSGPDLEAESRKVLMRLEEMIVCGERSTEENSHPLSYERAQWPNGRLIDTLVRCWLEDEEVHGQVELPDGYETVDHHSIEEIKQRFEDHCKVEKPSMGEQLLYHFGFI